MVAAHAVVTRKRQLLPVWCFRAVGHPGQLDARTGARIRGGDDVEIGEAGHQPEDRAAAPWCFRHPHRFRYRGFQHLEVVLFAHRCDWNGSSVFAVHNLSGRKVAAELALGDDVTGVDDLLELREHRVKGGKLRVELGAYGYLWLRARKA